MKLSEYLEEKKDPNRRINYIKQWWDDNRQEVANEETEYPVPGTFDPWIIPDERVLTGILPLIENNPGEEITLPDYDKYTMYALNQGILAGTRIPDYGRHDWWDHFKPVYLQTFREDEDEAE